MFGGMILGANISLVQDTPEPTDLCAQRFLIIFWQAVFIKPLLKKHNLDPEELNNYTSRPASNLHFMSKIIEKIVAQQLVETISIHSLHDPLQLAYSSNHPTETAIIKITNDIITRIDRDSLLSWHLWIFQLRLTPWTMTS